jgi:hypothetical protein
MPDRRRGNGWSNNKDFASLVKGINTILRTAHCRANWANMAPRSVIKSFTRTFDAVKPPRADAEFEKEMRRLRNGTLVAVKAAVDKQQERILTAQTMALKQLNLQDFNMASCTAMRQLQKSTPKFKGPEKQRALDELRSGLELRQSDGSARPAPLTVVPPGEHINVASESNPVTETLISSTAPPPSGRVRTSPANKGPQRLSTPPSERRRQRTDTAEPAQINNNNPPRMEDAGISLLDELLDNFTSGSSAHPYRPPGYRAKSRGLTMAANKSNTGAAIRSYDAPPVCKPTNKNK